MHIWGFPKFQQYTCNPLVIRKKEEKDKAYTFT